MKKLLITLFLSISCLFSFSQLAPLVQQAKNYLDSNIVSNTTRQITPTKLHTSIDKVIAALNYIDTSDLFKKDTILQVYPFTINIVDNIKYLSIDTSAGKWRSENYYDTKYLQVGAGGSDDLNDVAGRDSNTVHSMQVQGDNKYLGISSLVAFGGAFLNHNESAGGSLSLSKPSGSTSTVGVANLTGNRAHELPNASGTIALRAADSTGSPTNMIYQGTDGLLHKAAVPAGGSGTAIPNNEVAFGNGTGITSNSDFFYSTGSGGLFNVGFSGNVILQKTGNNYFFGDKDGINNQTYLKIDDANKKLQFVGDYAMMEGDNKVMGVASSVAFGSATLNHNETAGGTLSLATPAGGTSTIGVTNVTGSKDHQMPNASGTVALRAADSTGSPINMIYQGTDGLLHKAAVPAGGNTSARYVMSLTAPTDTTVGWIDLRYNFHDAYPVHNWVNGAWSHTDTTGGQFWDNVGMVFSRGRPYIIIATGQSNLGGPYIGEASNPNASPYNGYYGDTIPCRAVAAWDYNRNIWVVAKIRDTPFQYSSGANYLLIAAKKINEQTGRSVRIVTYPVGGTGLQCWLPDSTCYNEFKSRVQNSGIIHPNAFVWAQSEAGITPAPAFDTYFNRWIGMKDTMILDGLMDSTTLKILMASGDTLTNGNVISMANGTSAGEGALRALAATNDPTIKYVPLFKYQIQLTDGLHLLPKGHEITGEALFHSIMDGPKVAGRDMMGYGAPAPYKWSSNEQRLGMRGLIAINSNNKPYFGLGVDGNNTYYTAAEPNLTNQYSPGIEFLQASDIVRFSHYNSTTRFQLEQSRVLFNAPVAVSGSIEAYSGGDPEYVLNDIALGKTWKFQMANTTNELHFTYDGTRRFHFTKTGHLGLGLSGAEVPDSMVRIKGGLWVEGGARFSGLPTSGTYSKSLGVTSNGTLYLKDTVAHSVATLTGLGTGVATALAANTNATGGVLTGASSFSANVLTVLSDFRPTKTITAAGTTGAQTINKTTGTVNFAAGASTLVVTNSFAYTSSVIIVTVYGTDATAISARVTKAVGSFTITLNAAATAETAVGFIVTN